MITITLTLDESKLPEILKLFQSEHPSTTTVTTETCKIVEIPAVEETPVVEEAPVVKETPSVDKGQVRQAAIALSKAGKSKELADIVSKFGAAKLSDLKEADYAAAYDLMVKANG